MLIYITKKDSIRNGLPDWIRTSIFKTNYGYDVRSAVRLRVDELIGGLERNRTPLSDRARVSRLLGTCEPITSFVVFYLAISPLYTLIIGEFGGECK